MKISLHIAGPFTLLFLLLGLAAGAQAQATAGDDPDASPIWKKVRASLFQDRPIISDDASVIALEAPARAEDAAIVPIAIRALFAQTPAHHIDKIYLVIDNNPSPISATFRFTQLSGRADIETRVRVDQYTYMRAIAETQDGKLYMRTRFVKASGGCSAPPGKDMQAALAAAGRMKFRVEGQSGVGQPVLAQLMISHPNSSGLAMDQVSHLYAPAYFVRQLRVRYAGQEVMSADLDISISENPNFRFYFMPSGDGELKAEMVDTKDLEFAATLPFRVAQ